MSKRNNNKETLQEKLFLTDYDEFFKYNKTPYLLITHCCVLLISTYIIFSQNRTLDDLVFHNRAVQSAFFFHQDTQEPADEYKKYFYISSVPKLLEHLDKVIDTIYNINTTLTFNITFIKSEDYKIEPTLFDYVNDDINKTQLNNLFIKNETHNPIRELCDNDNDKVRQFLAKVKNLFIELNYNYTLGKHYYQAVTLELQYDFTSRGIIVYYVDIRYSLQVFMLELRLTDPNILLILFLIFFSILEVVLLVKKTYFNLKILMLAKANINKKEKIKRLSKLPRLSTIRLSLGDNFEEERETIENQGYQDFPEKKKKWNKVKTKDKMKFIPKWFLLFSLGDLFHLMSGVMFLSSGAFTPQNIIFFGFSSLFSWVSLGYYFADHIRYSYIYDTLSQIFKMYSKLLVVFAVLFSGFALAHITMFPSSIHWFNGGYNAFQTLGAEVFADSYLLIWSNTIERYALRTVFLAIGVFVVFTGCHLRTMFVMTEEAFQLSLLKKKFDWSKKTKISVEDYINREIALNEEEEADKNYFMDDIWIKAIVEKDDVNQILNFDVNKLQTKLYNIEQVKQFFYKKTKKIKKEKRSSEIMNEIFHYNFNDDMAESGKRVLRTETEKISESNINIERLFNKLKSLVNEVYLESEGTSVLFEGIDRTKKKMIFQKLLVKLERIKTILK